jgi:hypothetical protein
MKNLKSLGFVIASEFEDYLGAYIETRHMTHKAWVKTPNDAMVIRTKFQAVDLLRKLNLHYSAWVLELWENDKQLVVSNHADRQHQPSPFLPSDNAFR